MMTEKKICEKIIKMGGCGDDRADISCIGLINSDNAGTHCPLQIFGGCNKEVLRAKEWLKNHRRNNMNLEKGKIYRHKLTKIIGYYVGSTYSGGGDSNQDWFSTDPDSSIISSNWFVYDENDVEEVFVRHPMYGKKIWVWNSNFTKKVERIFLEEFNDKSCRCVSDNNINAFRRGKPFNTVLWCYWMSMPETISIELTQEQIKKIKEAGIHIIP